MIRDITIGQYYKTDSCIHGLDPRTKIIIALVYLFSLFLGRNPFTYILAFVSLILYIGITRIPIKFILKGLKAIWFIMLFTVCINLFTTPGSVLWQWGFLKVSRVGLQNAIYLGTRLVFMMIGASMMTYTTTPKALTDGMERLFRGLNRWKIPVYKFAMVMSIALRFIPILVEELDRIMRAQAARGADFSRGKLKDKLKGVLPILIPLFVSAIRRADELAMAMDARCYHDGTGRTKMNPLSYRRGDYMAYGVLLIYLAAMMTLTIMF